MTNIALIREFLIEEKMKEMNIEWDEEVLFFSSLRIFFLITIFSNLLIKSIVAN